MPLWTRRICWLALLLMVALYMALMMADFRYFGALGISNNAFWFLVLYLPWWTGWLPLAGLWLVVRGRFRRGRRATSILGGILVLLHAWRLGVEIYDKLMRVLGYDTSVLVFGTDYSLYSSIVVALAFVPVGLLARGRRADVPCTSGT